MPSFIIVGYVWQILRKGRSSHPPLPPISEQPCKSPSWIGLMTYNVIYSLFFFYWKIGVFWQVVVRVYCISKYLSNTIPSTTKTYASRISNNVNLVRVDNNYFINTFFPSTTTEWNKIDLSIRNSTSLNIFKGRLLEFAKS